uniref:TauD domain-containing protein n=2 Tax=Bursaphelenchus xylophilus TaxID=6326 RepID=A0A1I7SII9_BURXY
VGVWSGAISVGVLMPSPSQMGTKLASKTFVDGLSKIELLEKSRLSGKVGIHLFYERPIFGSCGEIIVDAWEMTRDEDYLTFLFPKSRPTPYYPVNTARNVARLGAKSRLFLSCDTENLPVNNYEPRMRKLAQKELIEKGQKMVLVHRRFEIADAAELPKSKTELFELYKLEYALEFHKNFYPAGHSIPFVDEWFQVPEDKNETSIFKIVDYNNGEWEPQFVGDTLAVPLHDESFPYPNRGHTELGYETCRAGFKFAVVNDLFTMHIGVKTGQSNAEKKGVRSWEPSYLRVVDRYLRRLDKAYPETNKKCGLFKP